MARRDFTAMPTQALKEPTTAGKAARSPAPARMRSAGLRALPRRKGRKHGGTARQGKRGGARGVAFSPVDLFFGTGWLDNGSLAAITSAASNRTNCLRKVCAHTPPTFWGLVQIKSTPGFPLPRFSCFYFYFCQGTPLSSRLYQPAGNCPTRSELLAHPAQSWRGGVGGVGGVCVECGGCPFRQPQQRLLRSAARGHSPVRSPRSPGTCSPCKF